MDRFLLQPKLQSNTEASYGLLRRSEWSSFDVGPLRRMRRDRDGRQRLSKTPLSTFDNRQFDFPLPFRHRLSRHDLEEVFIKRSAVLCRLLPSLLSACNIISGDSSASSPTATPPFYRHSRPQPPILQNRRSTPTTTIRLPPPSRPPPSTSLSISTTGLCRRRRHYSRLQLLCFILFAFALQSHFCSCPGPVCIYVCCPGRTLHHHPHRKHHMLSHCSPSSHLP